MTIQIGQTTFDRVAYDPEADTLYLHAGDPRDASDFDESPEGHALRFNQNGELVGVTIVGARELLSSTEPIPITLPSRFELPSSELKLALAA